MRAAEQVKSRLLAFDGDWPAYLRYWARRGTEVIGPLRYRGDRFQCPCCGGRFARFADFRSSGVLYPEARCPRCGSLPRQRVLWLYLERETDLLTRPIRALQIAPDYASYRRLSAMAGVDYVTGDLQRSPMISDRVDVTAIPFEDDRFDLILCSHVLEHVPDDRRALGELRRVLAPDGVALLQHPLGDRERTDEDPSVSDPEERLRRWGQADHVREYGGDYVDRLAAAGFDVTLRAYDEELSPEIFERCRLRDDGAHRSQDIASCRVAVAQATTARVAGRET